MPLCLLFAAAGCTNQQVYEAIQNSQRVGCQGLPQGAYEECMQKHSKPYHEYERERSEVVK